MILKVVHVLLMFIHERSHIVKLHLQVQHLETTAFLCLRTIGDILTTESVINKNTLERNDERIGNSISLLADHH